MKIALTFISMGNKYWQYIDPVLESTKKYFLTNHEVDTFVWTDYPDKSLATYQIECENLGTPFATLMRYHLFLQQEEKLNKYDYVFYCDIDMLFVGTVGDEILGDGLTAVEHPGYSFKPLEEMDVTEKMWFKPYERNPKSSAYFPRHDYYFAGGFQGGKTKEWIKAMREMKRTIDEDLGNNYIARWHDESHWNCYCFYNPPSVILDPSYCFPAMYPTPTKPPYETHPVYKKIWGKEYSAKLLALTKEHTLSKAGGESFNKVMKTL